MYSKADELNLFNLSKTILDRELSPQTLESLRDVLRYHEWKYYVQDDPNISDYEYDQLFNALKKFELEHPSLVTPDSPTQRVANDLTSGFNTVKHITPMLSLANSYNADDLMDFDKQIKKLLDLDADMQVEYSVEPKFDGGSIALIYENDLLTRSATRGNGQMGEEMTNNAKAIKSLPLRANFTSKSMFKVELRGEALIRKDNFEKINKKRAEQGLSIFANPRNAATGGLRMKNPNETAERALDVFLFQLAYAENENGEAINHLYNKQSEMMDLLASLGFKIPGQARKTCKNISEVIEFCETWAIKRDQYNYEIDGMVIKLNDLTLQEKCGSTAHHPRWAIAYKFKAKQTTSTLESVEYQVGKIGSITPVAKITPVALAGVTVSSISLHNEEFIQSKDLRIGDKVLVERAGDVIPYIVKSFPDLRTGEEIEIEFPKECPSCSTTLEKNEEEAAWRCPNFHCKAQIQQRLIFHVSKDAMDIDGFGKSYIERFYELGWVKTFDDIYTLDYQAIAELEGFGEKSAENLKMAIEKAKKNPIHRLLHSLSIHHLGKKASKIIAEQIKHVLELQDWNEEKYLDIKDIGPVVAENVSQFFNDSANVEMLQRLESLGVNLTQTEEDQPIQIKEDAPLKDKTILFTGTLQHLKRKDAQEQAALAGAKNISAVSSNLDILVVGAKAGSKLKKAQSLGTVQIITEDAFIEIVSNG